MLSWSSLNRSLFCRMSAAEIDSVQLCSLLGAAEETGTLDVCGFAAEEEEDAAFDGAEEAAAEVTAELGAELSRGTESAAFELEPTASEGTASEEAGEEAAELLLCDGSSTLHPASIKKAHKSARIRNFINILQHESLSIHKGVQRR